MQKSNVEQIIRELYRENYRLYPESYPGMANGLVNEEADDNVAVWASSMWDVRNEDEVERDDDLAITLADYTDWAKQEFYELTSEDYHNNPQAV